MNIAEGNPGFLSNTQKPQSWVRGGLSSRILVLLFCLIFAIGCSSSKKKGQIELDPSSSATQSSQNPSSEVLGPPEPYGPPIPPVYGPEPVQIRPVVLVLGPGLARGFAYVGVLRGLVEAKVPIGAVFGTELGALVGSLYVMSSSMNQFEWGLLKFKEDVFQPNRKFFGMWQEGVSKGEKLAARLKEVFKEKDISDSSIPLRISIQSQTTRELLILDRGRLVQALRASLAAPHLFKPVLWTGGVPAVSAAEQRPFLIKEAKSLGIGPVVVVDVLKDTESAIALDELKIADLIIRPQVSDIAATDFQKMTDTAFRGKKALNDVLPEIRKLVGLPEMDFEKRSSQP